MKRRSNYSDMHVARQLEQGVRLHNYGDYFGARVVYESVLERHPRNPDALHLCGLALHQQGEHAAALALIERAIAVNGRVADFHNNCGEACRALGNLERARACYLHALALDPRHALAHNNLGVVLRARGELSAAIAHWRKAIGCRADYHEAHLNLGAALCQAGEPEAAIALLERALALRPQAHEVRENLGNALREAGRHDEALREYDQALAHFPDRLSLLANRSIACRMARRFDEAVAWAHRALLLAPEDARCCALMGLALHGVERLDEALAYFDKALRARPDDAETRRNRCIVLRDAGRFDEARAACEAILAEHPEDAEAHFLLSSVLLATGDYARGWQEYEWRWRTRDPFSPRRSFAAPLWDGASPAGRTILVHAEQGAGDVIQFARFLAEPARRGARVLFQCPDALGALMSGVDGVARLLGEDEALPEHDAHVPLLTLARLLETRLDTLPAPAAYLRADPVKAAAWQRRLEADGAGYRIGIAWSGNPLNANVKRYCPLAAFAALRLPGVRLYSLQKGAQPTRQEHDDLGLIDHTAALEDFDDTAALIANLDLVVSICTSAAHLAAALGKPTWILLAHAADWRWLVEREDSPWYPTARLYRQARPGDWTGVFARVAADLHVRLGGAPAEEPAPAAAPAAAPAFLRERECRHGRFVFNANDQFVGRALDLYGEYSEGEIRLLAHYLREGDVVVEAGANLGAHTLALARRVGERGRVLAYEPQPAVFELLAQNAARNAPERIVARRAALGAAPGVLRVPELDPRLVANFGAARLGEEGIEVAVETIDALALARLALIKADVEGMELEVLRGARETIARLRPLLYLENDRRETSAALIAHILSLDYEAWWHLPPLYEPDNHAGNAVNVFPGVVSGNLFCAPREAGLRPALRRVAGERDWPL